MLTGVLLALAVSAFPTAGMILASTLLSKFSVPPLVEASLQNVAAGFILAAVGQELFPLLRSESTSSSILGMVCGLGLGMLVVFGTEALVEHIVESGRNVRPENMELTESHVDSDHPAHAWEPAALIESSKAISMPEHKLRLDQQITAVVDLLADLEGQCGRLMDEPLDGPEAERVAEGVDETIHKVNYAIDHCRRLLEGSEAGVAAAPRLTRLDVGEKQSLRRKLAELRTAAEHLREHVQDRALGQDLAVLAEMHAHMTSMERHVAHFHDFVDASTARWMKKFPPTPLGSPLPVGLVMTVAIDCVVDGFLGGITCALSPKAGIVLGAATAMEMGVLGMAYASRVARCAAGPLARWSALLVPPCLLLLASAVGALLADVSSSVPAIFITFVSFGVVALVALATGELLAEARELQGEDEKWYINALVFVAIFFVLILDELISKN